jgi:hypothetical protein
MQVAFIDFLEFAVFKGGNGDDLRAAAEGFGEFLFRFP